MPWLIDGSNVLGAMHVDRQSEESKRNLVRLLGGFAKSKKTRVTCVFDGQAPAGFGRSPGAVSVLFSGHGSADDIILERSSHGHGWIVVTADAALAARVRRRQVDVVAPQRFIVALESAQGSEGEAGSDWDEWLSDPKNRMKF